MRNHLSESWDISTAVYKQLQLREGESLALQNAAVQYQKPKPFLILTKPSEDGSLLPLPQVDRPRGTFAVPDPGLLLICTLDRSRTTDAVLVHSPNLSSALR